MRNAGTISRLDNWQSDPGSNIALSDRLRGEGGDPRRASDRESEVGAVRAEAASTPPLSAPWGR